MHEPPENTTTATARRPSGPVPLWVDVTLDLALLACLIALARVDAPGWITLLVLLAGLAFSRCVRRAVRARRAPSVDEDRRRPDPGDWG